MKIKVVSDLHTEFMENQFELPKLGEDKDTTLILSGDIAVGAEGVRHLLKKWGDQYKHVVYVAGNHEYYGKVYELVNDEIKSLCSELSNVHFLHRSHVEIEGIQFFGDTFWTPAGSEWENSIARWQMNDFKRIKRIHGVTGKYVNIDTDTYIYWFRDAIAAYKAWIENGFEGKRVVVSHHAPSPQSIHPHFYGNDLNAFYYFNASKYLKSLNNVVLFTHGHTHSSFDYIMRGTDYTRVVCNPFGYSGHEHNPYFDPLLLIDI